jgi:hypothetical protein
MSGLLHKVKEAMSGEKNTPEAVAANRGNNGILAIQSYLTRNLTN